MLFLFRFSRVTGLLLSVLCLFAVSCGGGGSSEEPVSGVEGSAPIEPVGQDPAPVEPVGLQEFTLSIENTAPQLQWTDANAEYYRVLIWYGDGEFQELATDSLDLTINGLQTNTQVVVEGYDSLGNSIFSQAES